MKTYRYTAYTPEGAPRKGVIVAEDEADASARINTMGLLPATLAPSTAARRKGRERRIDLDLLSVFTRQMAVLMAAGLTADAALAAVQTAAAAPRIERLAAEARALLLQGEDMAEALGRTGGALPPWYAAAVRAGEQSGDLAAIFGTLADYLETSAGDQAALSSALIYPTFVTLVAVVVCVILMTTVAPEIIDLFQSSGRPLPGLTVAVMAVIDALAASWPWLLSLTMLLALALTWVNHTPHLRARRDTMLLKTPLVGRFLKLAAAAIYLRALALAIGARLPLTEALRHSAGVLEIDRFRRQAVAAGESLKRGDSLAVALAGLEFLNPVTCHLVQAGEASARLGQMSERAAILAESWLRTERKRLTVILEPASMVIVGGMVLVIVLAILLPIFDMQALIG